MAYTSKLYLKKMVADASTYEVLSHFGIWLKDISFAPLGNVKDLYSNNWFDEDGEDEYVPSELKMASTTATIEFGYKTETGNNNHDFKEKFDALTKYFMGKDGNGAEFMFYSTHIGYGRQHVRMTSISDDAELVRDDGQDILTFKIEFKINDPVTDVILTTDDDGNYIIKV